MKRAIGIAAVMILVSACGPRHESYAEYGATLIRDPTISQSRFNAFACNTCHAERPTASDTRIYPGAPLAGSARRPTWWGGNVLDLELAVGNCYEHFMQGPRLDPNSDTAQALLAYLEDRSADAGTELTSAVSFTVPPAIHDVMPGNRDTGADIYARACTSCHGALHTGEGSLMRASLLPEETQRAHGEYTPACFRGVFIQKIRHGSYLGYAGAMPPFSEEVLSDAQLADLLAYLEVPTDPGPCRP